MTATADTLRRELKATDLGNYDNIVKKGDGVWLVSDKGSHPAENRLNVVVLRDGVHYELFEQPYGCIEPLDTKSWSSEGRVYKISGGENAPKLRQNEGSWRVYIVEQGEVFPATKSIHPFQGPDPQRLTYCAHDLERLSDCLFLADRERLVVLGPDGCDVQKLPFGVKSPAHIGLIAGTTKLLVCKTSGTGSEVACYDYGKSSVDLRVPFS